VATIKEVAKRAGVSVGTVSNVLGGSVTVSKRLRDRVLAAIKDLDYYPNQVARSLKIRQTNMIAVIVSDLTNPFHIQMVRGAEDAAWRNNYLPVTFNSDSRVDRERQVVTALRGRRVDGIVLLPAAPDAGKNEHICALKDSGVPIVCLDHELHGLDLDCVVRDNFNGALQSVRHLASLGHRYIALLNVEPHHPASRDHYLVYRQALSDEGLEFVDPFAVSAPAGDAAYLAAKSVLESAKRPSAFFTAGAPLAIAVLRALKALNLRCPEDVSLVTVDDPVFSEILRPRPTSLAQPCYEIGWKGVELLLQRIADPHAKPVRMVLEPTLHIRESSAAPAAARA
jgi:LacI family transcriptional regulator